MKIETKAQFSALSQAGKLGNFLRTWNNLVEVDAAGYRGWLTIQSKDKQSPHFLPWVTHGIISIDSMGYRPAGEAALWLEWNGAKRESMYFREVPGPNARRIIQFEAMLGPMWQGAGSGVELFYELDSTNPLRGIRERCQQAQGLLAQGILRTYLSQSSYETLTEIWDRHPTSIIEAVEFGERTGFFHERLIVFEVRDF